MGTANTPALATVEQAPQLANLDRVRHMLAERAAQEASLAARASLAWPSASP
jgi:hypothetical protein